MAINLIITSSLWYYYRSARQRCVKEGTSRLLIKSFAAFVSSWVAGKRSQAFILP